MSRRTAMASIEARQRREMAMQQFNAAQAGEARQRMVVDWEHKTAAKGATKDLYRYLDKVQAQHNTSLVERRKRLAALLQREKEQNDLMLSSLTETDEERRERLIRKAQELREKRLEDKRVDTEKRHDRLFREKIDSLRQAESRLKVMQVADMRYEQLEMAKQLQEEKRAEEAFFAQQAAEATRIATERAQKDLEAQYVRAQRLKSDLAAQIEGEAMRKQLEAEEKRKENEEFHRLLHEERCQETQKQMQRRLRQQEIAQEMVELNEELKRARKQEYDKLQQEDRATLNSILAQIAEEEKKEKEEKYQRYVTEKAHMTEVMQQMAQKKDNDSALDKLWKEANDVEWDKREARWNADQKKRDQLMHNILVIRRNQVLDKRQKEKDDANAKKSEHAAFLEELHQTDDIDSKERKRRMDMLRETQKYLDMQIGQRNAEKAAEAEAKRNELTSQNAMEKECSDRIEREMANLERAKPERFRHVPLLPPRQRNQPF